MIQPAEDPRRCTAALVVLTLVVLATVGHLVVFYAGAGMDRLAGLTPDDAGYYFRIARNICAGRGPTFDTIHTTNGFQPLWGFALVPLSHRHSIDVVFRTAMMIQAVMVGVAVAGAVMLVRPLIGDRESLLVALALIVLAAIPAVNGMESALLVMLLCLTLLAACRLRVGAGGPLVIGPVVLGVLLGLCMLARMDTVFITVAVCGVLAGRCVTGRARAARHLLTLLLTSLSATAIVLPYLYWNYETFGAIMPISGQLKSSFPRPMLDGYAAGRMIGRYWVLLAMMVSYLVWSVVRGRRTLRTLSPARRYYRVTMMVFCGSALMHFAHEMLFIRWAVFRWHFISYAVCGVLAAAEMIPWAVRRLRRLAGPWAYWVVTVAVIAGIAAVSARRMTRPLENNWQVHSYRAAGWARDNIGVGPAFAMKDAGTFGSFFPGRTVNLDGLVNSIDYQDVLLEKRLEAYLHDCRVGYVVQHAVAPPQGVDYQTYRMDYRSRKYPGAGDSLTFTREQEVYRSEVFVQSGRQTVLVIWKLPTRP